MKGKIKQTMNNNKFLKSLRKYAAITKTMCPTAKKLSIIIPARAFLVGPTNSKARRIRVNFLKKIRKFYLLSFTHLKHSQPHPYHVFQTPLQNQRMHMKNSLCRNWTNSELIVACRSLQYLNKQFRLEPSGAFHSFTWLKKLLKRLEICFRVNATYRIVYQVQLNQPKHQEKILIEYDHVKNDSDKQDST